MENGAVYNETTEPQGNAPRQPLGCSLRHLRGWRLPAKALQAALSLLAVICEEVVEGCIRCGGLYFFEFKSCSAFLLSLLVLFVFCTDAYETLGEDKVQRANFWAMAAIGVCFLLASVVLAATSSGSAAETSAWVFGFLAGGAFLAEVILEHFRSWKQSSAGCSEKPGCAPSTTESQPLNK